MVDEKPWLVDTADRVHGLQVILLKRIYIFPWTQFLYAEGTTEEVLAVFSSHDLLVKGSNLGPLLADFASQQITVLKEPARADRFTSAAGPRIEGVEVREVDKKETFG